MYHVTDLIILYWMRLMNHSHDFIIAMKKLVEML